MSFNEVTRSIKVRLYPDEDQKDLFYQNMGCTRLVHNYLLNAMQNDYKIIKGRGGHDFNLNNRKYYNVKLMELKRNPEYSFLYNVESSSL